MMLEICVAFPLILLSSEMNPSESEICIPRYVSSYHFVLKHINEHTQTNIYSSTYGGVMTTDDCVELTPNDDKPAFVAFSFFLKCAPHHIMSLHLYYYMYYNFMKRMFVDGVAVVYLRIFDIENN